MLRFDIPPVWSNAARLDAVTTFLFCTLALVLEAPYLLLVLVVQGLVRGFIGHTRCPSHRIYSRLLEKMGQAGHRENAGAKMFANKLLCIASTMACGLWLYGSSMWTLPATALLVFSFLEAALSFCAACWVYTLWYRLRGSNS